MSQENATGEPVILARIGKPHGLKGWLKLNSFTSPPSNLLNFQCFTVIGGAPEQVLEIDASSVSGDSITAHFPGYDDPESARALTGLALAVASEDLPALPAGEYYWHELEGLAVSNSQGELYGTVLRLMDTGAHDVLVVSPGADSIDDRQRLIPWRPGTVVIDVDLQAGTMTVDWDRDFLE